jgi:hypothetical protein
MASAAAICTDAAENIMHIAQMHRYCVAGRCIEASGRRFNENEAFTASLPF